MATQELVIHGVYQHYKGDYYIVEGVARHSETGEELVLYRGLYEDGSAFWARPKAMFLEEIEPGKFRFTLQNIKSKNTKSQH